jgi:hypothetical protein
MPKDVVDYSQTIIYKIFCKDVLIEDVYIGHTTNFTKRKYQHKISCKNGNKFKIYEIIRGNGGWENWDMVEIAKYNCKDVTEARIKEQEHYELNKKLLNDKSPYCDLKKYYCSICHIQCVSASNYKKHIERNKHKNALDKPNEIRETYLVPKSSLAYICELCEYSTCRKSQYDRHLATDKHKSQTFETQLAQNSSESSIAHQCICGINFNSRSTLWRHKKICNGTTTPSNIITTELVMELIKDNKEMKQIIMEQNNTINNLVKNCLVTNNNTIA